VGGAHYCSIGSLEPLAVSFTKHKYINTTFTARRALGITDRALKSRTTSRHTDKSHLMFSFSHLGVANACEECWTRIPEDDAGSRHVVEAGGGFGRRGNISTWRGGRGRLAEEIGDAAHDVHGLRPNTSRASPPLPSLIAMR
jgi:hypothetical protein